MNFLLENAELGNIQYNQLVEARKIAENRWDKIGYLQGLEGVQKENIAMLFENTLSEMRKKKHLYETTTAGSSGQFTTVVFPVIRRVFSKLLLNDIVSIQAINLAIGKIFYFNPQISTRKSDGSHYAPFGHSGDPQYFKMAGEYATGSTYNLGDVVFVYRAGSNNTIKDYYKAKSNGLTGAFAAASWDALQGDQVTQFETKSLYDAYYATAYDDYGTALYDRTRGKIEAVTATTAVVNGVVGTGSATSTVRISISGFSTTDKGKLIGSTGIPMDTESFLASLKVFPNGTLTAPAPYAAFSKTATTPMPINVVLPPYGQSIVDASGAIFFDVDMTYPAADYTPYTAGTATGFVAIYNKYSDLEQDSQMAEVSFKLDEVAIAVTTRKLRTQWTPELAMDVQTFQNIDAEAELTALMSETVAAEIDREGLQDIRQLAAWATRWDYTGLRKAAGTFYGVQKDWNQTLITKINQISAQIQKATLRGGANWVVVSPEISAVLNDLEYFHVSDASPESDQYNMGIERIGSLKGMYTVYRDAYAPANSVLIGRKGSSVLETGYIYAPYVPMELTGIITDPNTFTNIRGLMTRYAKKAVNNRFYGKISVDGLSTYGIGLLR